MAIVNKNFEPKAIMNNFEFSLKSYRQTNVPNRLNKIINKHAKELQEHFIKYGWDITIDLVEESIINELLGTQDILAHIKYCLAKKCQVNVDYTKSNSVFTLSYEPTYLIMDLDTGKLREQIWCEVDEEVEMLVGVV